jgi:alkylation response protein AidB-like acyl-CoA dehydrogenase
MREYSIERMLRDAKTIENLAETNLTQKALIGGTIIL